MSEYGQDTKWTKSPEDNQVAFITLPRPSRKGNLASVVLHRTDLHTSPVMSQSSNKYGFVLNKTSRRISIRQPVVLCI